MNNQEILTRLTDILNFKQNPFHPLVKINGDPKIGEGTCIGFFSEVNAKETYIEIGANCDIASFVAINGADSHLRCLGQAEKIARMPIVIGDNVFIGSHSVIKGGAIIGHHCVIAAGTIVDPGFIPPWSLVHGNPMSIKKGYYYQ